MNDRVAVPRPAPPQPAAAPRERARFVNREQLEAEADAIAGGAWPRGPLARPLDAATAAERTLVGPVLGGGAPVPTAVTASLSGRLNYSFANVRIHTDEPADRIARSLGARAWAFGPTIGLGGRPADPAAHPSLIHELVHAAQAGHGEPALLCDRDQRDGVEIEFAVELTQPLDADDLLVEFVRQYARLKNRDEAVAARDAKKWHWRSTPQTADVADVRRGFVLIKVIDRSLTRAPAAERGELDRVVEGMGEGERAALYQEVDRDFWERTRYKTGRRLGESADDRRMAEHWRVLRDDLLRTRQDLLALPPHVRAILFDPTSRRPFSPTDYRVALRVGRKLEAMSAIELAQWKSQISGVTEDWRAFEASLDRHIASEAEHRKEQLDQAVTTAQLHGLEAVVKARSEVRRTKPVDAYAAEAWIGMRDRYHRMLAERGLTEAQLDAMIAAWRRGFERETVRIADRLLSKLDHTLFEFERTYTDPMAGLALASAVADTGAAGHYATADRKAPEAICYPVSAMDDGSCAGGIDAVADAAVETTAARARGNAAMSSVAGRHPVVQLQEFPRERIATALAPMVSGIVLSYLAGRRKAIASTRSEIHGDSDFIYKLDQLLGASMKAQGIASGSMYELIIQDHLADKAIARLLSGIAVAVIAVALTIVTLGTTGPIAVAAGAAAFGLSAWQAVDAFREYATMSNAHDAELLSNDPSLFWLVIAVVGAAADLGAAVKAVRSLRAAAQALDATGDVAAFRKSVEAAAEVDARVARAASAAAESQVAISAQWRGLRAIGARANDILGIVAESGYRLMVLAWHLGRRGLYRFDQFLAELQELKLIAKAAEVTLDEARALREPWREGIQRARDGFLPADKLSAATRAAAPAAVLDEAAAYGRFLGLSDDTAAEVLELQTVLARTDPSALSPTSLQAAMRDKVGVSATADDLVAPRGLPRSTSRAVGAVEQAYEIGVGEGRRFLEGRGWQQWDQWINPFEFHGKYGQGIDDVFVDGAGRLVVVEYKGGSAVLAPGQMTRDWVRRQIDRLRRAGYAEAADALDAARQSGNLRGVVVTTPHGAPTTMVDVVF